MGRYYWMECKRLLHTKRFYIGIAGFFGTLCYEDAIVNFGGDVLSQIMLHSMKSFFIFIFAFSSLAYGYSLRVDDENQYLRQVCLNANLKKYLWAKAGVTYWSAVFVSVAGGLGYSFYERTKVPFYDKEMGYIKENVMYSVFAKFVKEGHYILYIFMWFLWIGLLAGMLALISMLLSYLVRNEMFAVVLPVMGYYALIDGTKMWGVMGEKYSLYNIYVGLMKCKGGTRESIWFAIVIAVVFSVMLRVLLIRLVNRKLRG